MDILFRHNFEAAPHKMNKGHFLKSEEYLDLSNGFESEYLPLANDDLFEYDRWLTR